MDSKLPEKIKRHKTNPFVNQTEIRTRNKSISFGSGNNVLVDRETGEEFASNVRVVREVDDAQFVKLFTQNIGMIFGFTSAGNKALAFLLWAVQNTAINKDLVILDSYSHKQFMENNPDLVFSRRTMTMGINELEKAGVIAKSMRKGDYFINPHFVFNGDRVRFITEIRRKSTHQKQQERLEKAGQQRLYD